MAPTKAKVGKQKGASALTPISIWTKRAGSKRLATTMNQSFDEQVPVAVHQDFSLKLDALMKVVTDLSIRVTGYEGRQKQREASVTPSPPTSPPRRRARYQGVPPPARVEDRMRKVTAFKGDTTDGNTSDEEEQPPPRRGNHLKSGIDRTRAFTVLHKVSWPHEVVYT